MLQADRDILDIDDVHLLGSPYARRDSKLVNVFLADGSSDAFAANIVFAGAFEVPPPQPPVPVSRSTADQTLPGSITVSASADIQPFGPFPALVVLAPGAQGALTVPVRLRSRNFSLRLRQLGSFMFPTVSSQSATFGVAISVDEDTSTSVQSSGEGLNLPFKLTSQSPRVTFDVSEGTTPAQFDAIIDPSGLNPGTYSAQLSIDIGGSVQTQTISWTIGPSIKLVVPGTFLDGRINPLWRVSNSQPSTQTITLDSTGDPINFTVQSLSSFLSVSPSQGQTPQDLTLIFMPMRLAANQTELASFQITTSGGSKLVSILYYVPLPMGLIPDAISSPGAPGGLFTWIANTSRCDVAELQSAPWPLTLGSCTIRVNGSPLPIGSITSPLSPVQPYLITAQLPYDVPLGLATMEIEDKNGRRSSLPMTVQAVSPVWVGQPFVPSPSRKVYDPLTLNFTGLGATDVPAPLGDVAASAIQPLARLEAFVGGRTARILSAQLSSTAVGMFDITLEVPPLAPDLYNVILKIDGTEIATGSIEVASSI
jgi:uncharacterized protein (TIGR03437 family)